jgi:hypothetical protein
MIGCTNALVTSSHGGAWLLALQTLAEHGFWTTVRINPLFPIYPDGYYTDPHLITPNPSNLPFFLGMLG